MNLNPRRARYAEEINRRMPISMKYVAPTPQEFLSSSGQLKRITVRAAMLAGLCAASMHSARADFSNVECKDFYGNVSVSGYTNIAGDNYANSASISVTRNNLSNSKGYINLAAAVLEWQPNVGYGVGVVRVSNAAGATMQGITSDSGSWAAGFWSDQIYGDPAIAELIVDNYGTMNGQAPNSTGSAFGFHNYTLYGGMNLTNQSGATCSATAKGSAVGVDSWCYYGPLNFVNKGTATGVSSGHGGEVDPRGIFLMSYDSGHNAPIYCENNGYIAASTTGGQTNFTYGAWVWAQGGDMRLINRGTIKGSVSGGTSRQAVGVYCGSNIGDDWVVNTGQIIAEGGPGWALGIENDDNNNWLGHIYMLNSGVISNGVTSGQACCGISGGMGMVLWVSGGPTYITNTASGRIHGGNMGIWAGVYGGPITIYNYGNIYGGSEGFHLGSGNDTVYLYGNATVTGVMDGGSGNNSLVFNLNGTLESVNGNPANSGNNLSAYGLGTSGNIVVSGKTYSWRNFNVSGTVSGTGGAGVTFYQDYNYGGAASQTLAPGSYTLSQLNALGMPNDWSSSVRVPSGYSVTMYSDYNLTGTSWTLTSDTPNFGTLSPNANDQVSSVKVSFAGTFKLIARHSGKAMDASGAQTANGTQISQWTYGGGNNQKWTLTDTGNGVYKIIGVQSGKSLDIYNGLTANGTKVELWDYWGGAMQQFTFSGTDSGYYRITPNNATGSCLDVSGISTADGANVQLWQWLNGSNQQWSPQAP